MTSIVSPPLWLDGDAGGSNGSGGGGSGHSGGSRRAGAHRSTSSTSGHLPPGFAGSQSPSSTGSTSSSSSLLTIVKAQISFLLSTLTDDNFVKNRSDIAGVSLSLQVA